MVSSHSVLSNLVRSCEYYESKDDRDQEVILDKYGNVVGPKKTCLARVAYAIHIVWRTFLNFIQNCLKCDFDLSFKEKNMKQLAHRAYADLDRQIEFYEQLHRPLTRVERIDLLHKNHACVWILACSSIGHVRYHRTLMPRVDFLVDASLLIERLV